jgi:hypothetical protein
MKDEEVLELYIRTRIELQKCYEEQVDEKIGSLKELFIAFERRDKILDSLFWKIMIEYLEKKLK